MKQKYQLFFSDDKSKLIVKEMAETDPGIFMVTCEENFTMTAVEAAEQEGMTAVIELLRTDNMFPPARFVEQMADAVLALIKGDEEKTELLFNDIDMIEKAKVEELVVEEVAEEEEEVELDDLLGEGDESEADQKKPAAIDAEIGSLDGEADITSVIDEKGAIEPAE